MLYQHVIFDLDGTLVDSASEIHEAAAFVCNQHGLALPSQDYIRQKTGSPPSEFFLDHGCDPAAADSLVATFRQRLADYAGNPDCVFPEVEKVLAFLHQQGIRISLATTKPSKLAIILLERYGLLTYFSHVQGTDQPLRHKPHPDILNVCLSHAPQLTALMVGDTTFDIEAASHAGIDSVGVTLGAHGASRLSDAQPTHMITGMQELIPILGLNS
jgi:phosphoglycolate phosphatase